MYRLGVNFDLTYITAGIVDETGKMLIMMLMFSFSIVRIKSSQMSVFTTGSRFNHTLSYNGGGNHQ